MVNEVQPPAPRRYVWPWFVLAGLLLGVVLTIAWMSVAIRKTREQRDPMYSNPTPSVPTPRSTNTAAADDRLAKFRDALNGGDAAIGRKIFFERPDANCAKCHRAGGQ